MQDVFACFRAVFIQIIEHKMKQMKKKIYVLAVFVSLVLSFSCKKEKVDKTQPEISLSFQDAFPVNCDTLYFGEAFVLKAMFSDDFELGSYSIDIHHNFDHHSHSTEITECSLDSIHMPPLQPYLYIQDYQIPEGLKEYETGLEIFIPASGDARLFEAGDYHFLLQLTDKAGWTSRKGLSIKMLHRR